MNNITKITKSNNLLFKIIFFTIFIFSNSIFLVFNTSSLRTPMVITILLIAFLTLGFNDGKFMKWNKSYLIRLGVVVVVFLLHSVISVIMFGSQSILRSFPSFLLIVLMLVISPLFVSLSLSVKDESFDKIIKQAYYFLVAFGFVMAFFQKTSLLTGKNMIIFKEPSHFALVLLPLCAYKLYISGSKKANGQILVLTVLALILENLTFLVGIALIFIILNWKNKSKLLLILFTLSLILFIGQFSLDKYFDLSYYFDRIKLSLDSNNLSVLVFVSGWERAYINLVDSYGFGIGFQRLGYIGEHGIAMENIYTLLRGSYINLYDAGSTAPKLVSEIGILGIVLLTKYIYEFYRLTKVFSLKKIEKPAHIFFSAIFLTFTIQLFVRGVGYFSPMTFVFTSSMYALFTKNDFGKVKEVKL